MLLWAVCCTDMERNLQESELFSELEAELRAVCSERDDLATRVECLEHQLTVVSDELNGARRDLDRSAAAAVDDHAADRRRTAELESRLTDADGDNRRLCEVIVEVKAERADLRIQLDEAKDKLSESGKTVTRLKDEGIELNGKLQGLSRGFSALRVVWKRTR